MALTQRKSDDSAEKAREARENSQRLMRVFSGKRVDGMHVVWVRPKRVVTSTLEFVVFTAGLGVACWAVSWCVTSLVGLFV